MEDGRLKGQAQDLIKELSLTYDLGDLRQVQNKQGISRRKGAVENDQATLQCNGKRGMDDLTTILGRTFNKFGAEFARDGVVGRKSHNSRGLRQLQSIRGGSSVSSRDRSSSSTHQTLT